MPFDIHFQRADPQHPVVRADLRYTNGFTVERGEGDKQPGAGKPAPSQSVHRLALAAPSPRTVLPLLPVSRSPFPIPGFTT